MLDSTYAFFSEHWFLGWCALWLLWLVPCIFLAVIHYIFRICNRLVRMVNIAIRGWPPSHLDADGDRLYINKKPQDN